MAKRYFKISDVKQQALTHKSKVSERGKSSGFHTIDPYISYVEGHTTTVVGHPGDGKTQYVIEELCHLSSKYGDKNVCYLTEAGTEVETVLDIVQTHVKKALQFMTDDELLEGLEWMEQFFYIIDISKELLNIREIYETVRDIEVTEGVKINNVVVDHYHNILPVPEQMSTQIADKVKFTYQAINRTSKKFSYHTIILFHVKDVDPVKCSTTGMYYLPKPEMWMISGGVQSSYHGQQVISLWRPIKRQEQIGIVNPYTGIPFELNMMIVTCLKVKPKNSGKLGGDTLMWDWEKQSYYEIIAGKKYYVGEYESLNKPTPSATLKPSRKFDDDEIF